MAHSSQCIECLRYKGEWKCEAFPKGIPRDIYSGEFDHSKPYEGDNGLQRVTDLAEYKPPEK